MFLIIFNIMRSIKMFAFVFFFCFSKILTYLFFKELTLKQNIIRNCFCSVLLSLSLNFFFSSFLPFFSYSFSPSSPLSFSSFFPSLSFPFLLFLLQNIQSPWLVFVVVVSSWRMCSLISGQNVLFCNWFFHEGLMERSYLLSC